MSSSVVLRSFQRGFSTHSSRIVYKYMVPSLFTHDVRLAIVTLRRHYSSAGSRRELHFRRKANSDNTPKKDSSSSSSFQESDVAKEVRESINKQKEADEQSWKEDSHFTNKSEKESNSSKKSFFSSPSDSETYTKTVEKMMNSEDVSPLLKKVLEKELRRSKANESVEAIKEEGKKLSKEDKEVKDWFAGEEMIIKQATEAIENMENAIKSDTCPEFLKPFGKSLIERMKKLRSNAQKNIKEMEEEIAQEAKEETEGAAATMKGEKSVEEEVKKVEEAVKSTKSTESTSSAAGKAEKETKGTNKAQSTNEKSSDFVKNLKPTPNRQNELVKFFDITLLCAVLYMLMAQKDNTVSITYDQFVKDFLLTRHAKRIIVKYSGVVLVEIEKDFEGITGRNYNVKDGGGSTLYYAFSVPDTAVFMKQVEEMELEAGWSRFDFIPMEYRKSALPRNFVPLMIDILFLALIFGPMFRGKGGMGNMMTKAMGMESKNIEIVKKTGVTFKDVAGIDEAKTEIMEFIDFLKNSDKYAALGAKLPKGAILTGPPGTGKTLLVKAAAGEANVPFISMSGSDFVELFVGMGAKRVRELFAEARKNAPCIVFIDEIDAIGKKRNEGKFSGSNDEREQTLNQILIEMDGFKPRDGVTIFAGTNRVDVLDPALLRAGRFDRHIAVDKPDIRGRKEIAKIYLAKIKFEGDLDEMAQKLAEMTPGYTGADICNIVNEAAIIAIRNKHEVVQLIDLISAVDRILCGMEKKQSVMTPEEKRRIAYHEAGHAVIGWMSEHVDPMLKVTIVPRANGALGFTQNLPKEIPLYSQDEMSEMLVQLMGGRAAEKMFCGNMTTGASDDLNKATKMAYGMVAGYGFNDIVGPVNYQQEDESFQKPFSESTGNVIDEETQKILKESMKKALAMLDENKEKMVRVAELLLERETITSVDMEAICGQRKGRSPSSYSNIIRDVQESEKKKEEEKKEEVSATSYDSSYYPYNNTDAGDSGDSGDCDYGNTSTDSGCGDCICDGGCGGD